MKTDSTDLTTKQADPSGRLLEILKPLCGDRVWQREPFVVSLMGRRFVAAVDGPIAVAIQTDAPARVLESPAHDWDPVFLALPKSNGAITVNALNGLDMKRRTVTVEGLRLDPMVLRSALATVPKRGRRLQVGTFSEPWPRLALWTSSWRAVIAAVAKDEADKRRIEVLQDLDAKGGFLCAS